MLIFSWKATHLSAR